MTAPKYTPCYRIQLVRERKVPAERMAGPREVASTVREYLGAVDVEHVVVILLNTQHKPIGIVTAGVGTLDTCLIHPREIFKSAIAANAAAIIVAHNHPSGDVTPSPDDTSIAHKLRDAARVLEIPMIDFIVVSLEDESYTSYVESGLLA